MSEYIEREFDASIDAYPQVLSFVEEQMDEAECPMKVKVQVSIALEEIFVNVAHYAYPGGEGKVLVGVEAGNGRIRIAISDWGLPFNPLEHPNPDLTLSVEERGIGGLGIYMVKQSMDEITYTYENGKNVLVFAKCY